MSDVITLVTAPAGSGKSYTRTRWLVDHFLPEDTGDYWSNLPIFPDKIAAYVAGKTSFEVEEIRQRLNGIPDDVCESWRLGDSGPWEFFKEVDLSGCHVVLDEAHEFISKKHPRKHKREWQKWLGQIRHRGCKVELVTQHVDKIALEIQNESGLRVELVNVETSRDPFLKIRMGDWYELIAAWLTREVTPCIWEIERRQVDGKWQISDNRRYYFDTKYFEFYDSYSLPETGGVKAEAPKREFEKRSRLGLTWWFVKRNFFRLGKAMAIVAFFIALPWLLPQGIQWGMSALRSRVGMPSSAVAAVPDRSAVRTGTDREPSAPSPALPGEQGKPGLSEEQVKEREELSATRVQLRELQKQLAKSSLLVGITETEAVLSSGGRVKIGDKIDAGALQGKVVTEIDWVRRAVVLDDGTVLRLGTDSVMPEWRAGGDRSLADRPIQRVISRDRGRSSTGFADQAIRQDGDDLGRRNVDAGILPSPGGQGEREHSVGRKLR